MTGVIDRFWFLPDFVFREFSNEYDEMFPEAVPDELCFFERISTVFDRIVTFFHARVEGAPERTADERIDAFRSHLGQVNGRLGDSSKPVVILYYSTHDHNGAILGEESLKCHKATIRYYEDHGFAVAAKVGDSSRELLDFVNETKRSIGDREIRVLDINAHGQLAEGMALDVRTTTARQLGPNAFNSLADDAAILVNACSAGGSIPTMHFGDMVMLHRNSVARQIARLNPGKRVFGCPEDITVQTTPVIHQTESGPRVVGNLFAPHRDSRMLARMGFFELIGTILSSLWHDFFSAHTAREFFYTELTL